MAFRITCVSLGVCVGVALGMVGMGAGDVNQPAAAKADAKHAAAVHGAIAAVDNPKNKNSDGTLKVVVHFGRPMAMGHGRHPYPLIRVPDNTLGPGAPLWVQRDHAAASAQLAQAEADIAKAAAARARPHAGLVYGDEGDWHAPFSTYSRFHGPLHGPLLAPGAPVGPVGPAGPVAPDAVKDRK